MNLIPEHIKLRDNFTIPRIVKGAWQLAADHSNTGRNTAIEDMFAFADAGMNAFDCGDVYEGVEELIGMFIKERKRVNGHADDIKVLTKYIPDYADLDRINKNKVEEVINRSLQRLNLERLAMVQLAWWSYESDRYTDAIGWLDEIKKEGKIEQISIVNFNTISTEKLIDMGVDIVTCQQQYSILDSRPEKSLSQLCKQHNIHYLCYGTVAGGFLSKRWLDKPEPQEPYENRSLQKYKLIIDDIGGWEVFQNILRALDSVAEKHNVSITNVATRYVLERPMVGAVIIGARNLEHLQDNLRIFDFCLDEDDYILLDASLEKRTELKGDVWDLERDKEGRHGSLMNWNLHAELDG